MNEGIIFGLAGMAFIVLLLAILFIPLAKVWQTKIITAKEEMYQKLAADAIDTQKETLDQNKKLASDMSEVKERLESIERILKEVE